MSVNLGLVPGKTASLDTESLGLVEARDIEIARVIAEETERQRATIRLSMPPTEVPSLLMGSVVYDYAASIPWEDLLAGGVSCVLACSERLRIPASEILHFAKDKCRPGNFLALFWMSEYLRDLGNHLPQQATDDLDARAVLALKRVKEGAIEGGRKSGQMRRQKSTVPSREQLLLLRAQLIASGRWKEHQTAAKLAKDFDCSPAHIRRLLKNNSAGT
jgi:hypothetical protein